MAGIVQPGAERLDLRFGQLQLHADIGRMRHVQQHALAGGQFAPQGPFQFIAHPAAQHHLSNDGHPLGLLKRRGHRVGVGPHQPSSAQLDAAKVAHHGGQHAFQLLVTQHVQHGAAGSAAGLAVIDRRRLPARQQGPADMDGPGVQRLQACHLGIGLGPPAHRHHPSQETAFLDQQFRFHRPGQRRPLHRPFPRNPVRQVYAFIQIATNTPHSQKNIHALPSLIGQDTLRLPDPSSYTGHTHAPSDSACSCPVDGRPAGRLCQHRHRLR